MKKGLQVMVDDNVADDALQIAQRWCSAKGDGWAVGAALGKGATAPVFEVSSPEGPRALKIYDARFSTGERAAVEAKRIDQQLALKGHTCPFLVQIYEGGTFEGRLFLLMSRAPGRELEQVLPIVPRDRIRSIVGQIAQAAIFLRDAGLCHRDIKVANVFVSDDFSQCTLLDVSVVRQITDPIGIGTDHAGQLPIVATARYSPPEYLFRLLEPGADLWHALNVYQLGALLHDLIMREPLFQAEYARSSENRYRFAWIVATVDPKIAADDVDQDLVLLARRALDKEWQRRSQLRLEDFLSSDNTRRKHALQILGFVADTGVQSVNDGLPKRRQRVQELARTVDEAVIAYLRKHGVTARHENKSGPTDVSRVLSLEWDSAENGRHAGVVELTVSLGISRDGSRVQISVSLRTLQSGVSRTESIEMPEIPDGSGMESDLIHAVISGFEQLAVQLSRAAAMEGA